MTPDQPTNPHHSPDRLGVGVSASRLGPRLAFIGLVGWAVTIAVYLWLAPPRPMPGDLLDREATKRLVIAVVLGAFGTFFSSITSAIGMFLSVAERRWRPGRRADLGTGAGIAGILTLILVVIEILRRVRAG